MYPTQVVYKRHAAFQELPIVARDATFLISLATEEFIRRLSEACQKLAEREKRATVQQKDVGTSRACRVDTSFLSFILSQQV
jgi:DNA polymerase epsilon subunit 4